MRPWLASRGNAYAWSGLLGVCVMATSLAGAPVAGTARCLFATVVDDKLISAGSCGATDPRLIARDEDVRKLIVAIDVPPESITFRGCPGDVYMVRPGPGATYTITYPPLASDGFVAPVAHELAHIVQIRASGGMDQLVERYESRRIELGADYLAGILFRSALPGSHRNDFQNHVHLNGLYRESPVRAHGSPVQRTNAFRLGVVGLTEPAGTTLAAASVHFQEDMYARVVTFDK